MKTFVELQFNYFPLHFRTLHDKINRIHERPLKIVYSDYKASFNTLLKKDGSVSIHHGNIQSLGIEISKFFCDLSPAIIGGIIKRNRRHRYNLRTLQELHIKNQNAMRYDTETIPILALKIWVK